MASTRGLPLSANPSSEWKIKEPPPRGSNRIHITVLLMQFLSDFTSVRLVKAQARSVSAVRWQCECEPPRTRGAVWMAARSLETMETRAATIARHKKHTPGYKNGQRRMQCMKKRGLTAFSKNKMRLIFRAIQQKRVRWEKKENFSSSDNTTSGQKLRRARLRRSRHAKSQRLGVTRILVYRIGKG